jgi:hypothetical protein
MRSMIKTIEETARNNIDGIASFIYRLIYHDGDINLEYLYQVNEQDSVLKLVPADSKNKINNLSIMIGGEIPNSFCPIYEVVPQCNEF